MKIGVIGASGLVGRTVLRELEQIKDVEITCYASKKSKGKIIDNHEMIELTQESIKELDYAIFCAGSKVSQIYAHEFIKKGATVIDNSSFYRRDDSVPLIIPEINFNKIKKQTKLIANPNCSTIQIALPLHVLNNLFKLEKVVVSTYQSASGAGQNGLDDLDNKTTNKFSHILYDDLIPQIDGALENNFTKEEDKIRFELKKILNLNKLKINATAVRVPIHYCHGASVYVECKKTIDIAKFEKELKMTKGIKVLNDLKQNIYPLANIAKGTNQIYVGRVRQDLDNKKALCFWVVADNLRKGAATNAVQIMQKLIKKRALEND